MTENHTQETPTERKIWATSRLWDAARQLPIKRVPIAAISEFDQDCWFGGVVPTCREVAEHARRIQAADLTHPIILSADGKLMDGVHRLAKAWLQGECEIAAVQFEMDPPPDHVFAVNYQLEISFDQNCS